MFLKFALKIRTARNRERSHLSGGRLDEDASLMVVAIDAARDLGERKGTKAPVAAAAAVVVSARPRRAV